MRKTLSRKLEETEEAFVLTALVENSHNMWQTAKALGIGRATLYRKVKSSKVLLQSLKAARVASIGA